MKKLFFIILIPVLFTSCLDEGSNYLKYTGWINVDSVQIQDSAVVGESVPIIVNGGAPNGCWSALELFLNKESDSVYLINGSGIFESDDGVCTDVYQIVDSTFIFKPSKQGVYKFYGQSPGKTPIIDSLIVVDQNSEE